MPLPLPQGTSRSAWLPVVLTVLALLGGPLAHGQIVHERPAKIKAANRRALREANRIDSPYKESHLDVTRGQLKRGESTANQQPVVSKELEYKTGTAPNVKPAGLLGLRRNKTSTLMREERRELPKKAKKGRAKKND